jgi:hypothetical protein
MDKATLFAIAFVVAFFLAAWQFVIAPTMAALGIALPF